MDSYGYIMKPYAYPPRAYPPRVAILIKDSRIRKKNLERSLLRVWPLQQLKKSEILIKDSARGSWILISDLLRVDTSAADKKSSKP